MPVKYYFIGTSGKDYEYFMKCNINGILKKPMTLLSKDEAFSSKLPILDA